MGKKKVEPMDVVTIINPLFSMIMDSVTSLLEQNAMNHTPTDEELSAMQADMTQVQKNLEIFACQAKEKAVIYEGQINTLARQVERMTSEQLERSQELDQAKALKNDFNIQLAQSREEYEAQKALLETNQRELSQAVDRAREARRDYEKRKKKMKKWCWVPFYGLGLVIDTYVKDFEGEADRARRRCEEQQRHCEEINRAYKDIEARFHQMDQYVADLERQCSDKQAELNGVTAKADESKKEMVYWENMFMKVNNLLCKVKAGQTSPDVLMEILELMEKMDEEIR